MKPEQLRQAIGSATALTAQYAGSDASRTVTNLLDLLMLDYAIELESVKPENLQKLQGQIAQCRRLRDVIAGVPHADARI